MSRSDEQRFRELYDRTYDPVWAFVLRRTPDEEAAADVVSETFLAVWRRIRDVPTDRPEGRRVGVRHRAACSGQLVAGHEAAGTALRAYSTATG